MEKLLNTQTSKAPGHVDKNKGRCLVLDRLVHVRSFKEFFTRLFFLKMEFRTLNSFELLLKNKARNTGILPQEGLSDIL